MSKEANPSFYALARELLHGKPHSPGEKAIDIDVEIKARSESGGSTQQKAIRTSATSDESKFSLNTQNVDTLHSSQNVSDYFRYFVPVYLELLVFRVQPAFNKAVPAHRTRHAILEILSRLPSNDQARNYTLYVLNAALVVLRKDNEKNAVIALRIVYKIHKTYRTHLEDFAKKFLEITVELYKYQVKRMDRMKAMARVAGQSKNKEDQSASAIPQSPGSFVVLRECPVIIVFILSVYPKFCKPMIPVAVPPIVDLLEHTFAHHRTLSVLGMRAALPSFYASQVKMVSILSVMLKAFPHVLQKVGGKIAEGLVSLLRICDATMTDTRRELLVAVRRILASELRAFFTPHINTFLDDAFLLGVRAPGDSVTTRPPARQPTLSNLKAHVKVLQPWERALQPRAYNVLADIIHHSREKLKMAQIQRAVFLFSRTLLDVTQTAALQTISAHLLINLTEVVFTHAEADGKKRRTLMMTVARAFIERVELFAYDIAKQLKGDAAGDKKDEPLKPLSTYYEATSIISRVTLSERRATTDRGRVCSCRARSVGAIERPRGTRKRPQSRLWGFIQRSKQRWWRRRRLGFKASGRRHLSWTCQSFVLCRQLQQQRGDLG